LGYLKNLPAVRAFVAGQLVWLGHLRIVPLIKATRWNYITTRAGLASSVAIVADGDGLFDGQWCFVSAYVA
jgi:hypothetical protein